MSRKAKMPLKLPKGVDLVRSGSEVCVKGPKGSLSLELAQGLDVRREGSSVVVGVASGYSFRRTALLGLSWALLRNMIHGVSEGFEKKLELVGVGYRASIKGGMLDLQLGYSHPTQLEIPKGISVQAELKSPVIVVSGIDKQQVGQFAAEIRAMRKPEPYQGKGVRYLGEILRRKAGKAGGKSGKKK
ncbi:50S ribosomal protein L6 [Candidatus Similichlamydia laticola]|uniref:Large ribosomal subunit protein uL6 n=1 Tax=Candidatus Similichlamydia laticola TaxID=2170265 RepID=A0A369KCR6_9BACT|nr:50S ribosomal protein L6 [Candidatus Similichlamydia laticola]RDB31392.1 LSU ribosomal protein L6p (L9e) [Candidatus Similichlamydia laticola]